MMSKSVEISLTLLVLNKNIVDKLKYFNMLQKLAIMMKN